VREFHIIEQEGGFTPYGGARDMWRCRDNEVILSGPAETGKTRSCLEKVDAMCWKYPNLRGLMARKTYKSLRDSAVITYTNKVLGSVDPETGEWKASLTPVRTIGGEIPQAFVYPNGSRIRLGGMDNPDKVLSAEYDFVYIPQAEELELDDWEKLTTRATGRAGNLPWGAQVLGDVNPGPPSHWILKRKKEGLLRFFESRHEDNPTLFDPVTGEITEQGKRSLAILDKLTGVRKERLRYGKWVQAEGAVFEGYDSRIHLIDRFEIPRDWTRIRVIDFGFTHAFVCQWWAIDHDGRMYRYREMYKTKRTVATHAQQIKRLSEDELIYETICDHDAEDRHTLAENGIPNIKAYKDVMRGIQAVQERLQPAGDGKPRLFLLRDSLVEMDQDLLNEKKPVCTEDEIEGYVWANKSTKEQPTKENDHGVDTMRYAVAHVDKLMYGQNETEVVVL